MIKVCHITSAHPRYDIRIFLKECITLANSDYAVSLIVADDLADEVYAIENNSTLKNNQSLKHQIPIYNVGKAKTRFKRICSTPKSIYNKILQLKPDIVHFHDPELIFIGLKLIKHGFKVIYDVHEDLPKQVMNKYWLPKFTRKLASWLVELLEQSVAKRLSGIVAATTIIATRFARYNKNTVVICNYPLLSNLAFATDIDDSNRNNKLCYIGSIAKTRGIITLIESLSISNITLELAGSFSGDVTLDDLSKLSGRQYVNYHGVISHADIIKLLSQVGIGMVTLLPTPSYLESLPIKMFEYMSAGIPVIASDFPLWRDIITKHNCGLLVDPNDPLAIASACKYLITHADEAAQMGKNGQAAVKQYFNWEIESRKLINFYQMF